MGSKLASSLVKKCIPGLIVAALAFTSAGCAPARDNFALIPEAWNPSLEQAREFVEEMPGTQSPVNQKFLSDISQHLADIRDAQLFIAYVRLMQSLDAKQRTDLFREQRRWLEKRAQAAKSAVLSKGGSLAPLERNNVFRKMTEERLSELRNRLNQNHNNKY
jgi:uncharacterized protein YecT (DUF1311 family)